MTDWKDPLGLLTTAAQPLSPLTRLAIMSQVKPPPCETGCGRSGGYGWGLLPPGAEAWTQEQHDQHVLSLKRCWLCSRDGAGA